MSVSIHRIWDVQGSNSSHNGYRPGEWLLICDRCGSRRYSSEVAHEWTGLVVCRVGCWEPRHPQDFVRGVADNQTVPFTRPEPADVFLSVGDVTADDL